MSESQGLRVRWVSSIILLAGLLAASGCGGSGAKGDGAASGAGGATDARGDDARRGGAGGAGGVGGARDGGGGCVNSLDCGADQVCDRDAGHCVQCLVDADCKSPGQRCVEQVCMTPAQGCRTSVDCASTAGKPICDTPTGRCVRCLAAADCPMSNDCTNEACVPYTTCMNSLACPQGQVCDAARMRCVQCVGDNDCAMDERCASNACRKKCTSDNMCTPMGMLCDIAHGYCVSCLASTDCKKEQYCSDGICLADLCTAGMSSCQNNTVVTCKADGSGFATPVACATAQTCVETSGMATCRSQLCTPTVTYCDPLSEKVMTCAADGLTASTKQDCATSSQVCVAGACASVVCPKGTRFCQGQELRMCSAKGDASSVVQTCTAAQYCDGTSMACKTRLCTPNQPACSANVRTTCNADGSGYLAGGVDCSPQLCSAGACMDVILRATFDDGGFAGWTAGNGNYTITGSSTPGANGSASALLMTKVAAGTVPDGLSWTFATGVQPRKISYWTKASSTLSSLGFTRLVNASGATPEVLFYSYFGPYLFANYASSYNTSMMVNTWYHIELRNIDWVARTFDYYLNGVSLVVGAKFAGTSTSITRIELYSTYYSSTTAYPAYWDEIELLP